MTPLGGNRAVIERAIALRADGRRFALALVTDTEGSTYRKPGALALVTDAGERLGTLSGGCLEPALDQLARDTLASGRIGMAMFDTRSEDDLVFGSGSGCRGRMRVLAWPIGPEPRPLFDALVSAYRDGVPLELALIVEGEDAGRGLAWRNGDAAPAKGDALALSLRGAPDGLHTWEGTVFARLCVDAPPRLLLLGAGPEAPPLLQLARTLGWFTSVADHRPALLDATRLADADRRREARPSETLAAEVDDADAVLVMTHLASTDLEALRVLARHEVPYIGLLGPPGRRDELLAELSFKDREVLRPRLHAPVGLPLGGEGPESIALAITADLQRHFNATEDA
ncbi:XdhC family protein [Arenimonas sp. MALMAid1274]|uniref:XdhC family protein n=1 Tax=Arenimonas sp. MALMAid1274 TaxID=3411630 RepID=UPI003BA07A3B